MTVTSPRISAPGIRAWIVEVLIDIHNRQPFQHLDLEVLGQVVGGCVLLMVGTVQAKQET